MSGGVAEEPDTRHRGGRHQRSGGGPWPGRTAWLAFAAVAVAGLFLLYLRQARSEQVSSDGASIILQSLDMLHGNLLLHGWAMSDVSFYSTELVQYMLLEAVLPVSPGLVAVAGAMTYTILVLLAALIARGRATGKEGIIRGCIGGGIMLAPALGTFTATLLHTPDHLGSAVPVLLAWLIIDRYGPRWYVPVVAALLLTWGQVADPLVELTGAAAMAVACAGRACYQLLRRRRGDQPWQPLWFEPAVAAAALLSIGAAKLVTVFIRLAGGFVIQPVGTQFAGTSAIQSIVSHAALTGKGLLGLFGVAFWPEHPAPIPASQVFFSWLHLVGVLLALAGLGLALWRFFRADGPLTAGFAVAIILNVAAYASSGYASDILSIRETSAVLPFAAVLAGRLLAGPVARARLVPVLAAAGAGYLAVLGVNSTAPAATSSYQNLAEWLSGHHLSRGLATDYWLSNIMTVDTGNQVQVRQVTIARDTVDIPAGWGSGGWGYNVQWYDPARNSASFLVTNAAGGSPTWHTQLKAAEATFGRPARTYRYAGFTVFTWKGNLLRELRP
jgi:hypothetical protein